MRNKGLRAFTLQSVFKSSAFLAAESLDGLAQGNNLEKLVIRNLRGFSPLSLIKKLQEARTTTLKHLVFDNLNMSQTFSEELLQMLKEPGRFSNDFLSSVEKLQMAPIRVEKSLAGDQILEEVKHLIEARSRVG